MSDDGRFPLVDLEGAETIFEPPGDAEGYWVGAPCIRRHEGSTYLAVRWRTPDRRGHTIAIYERVDGDYEERNRITAADLGVVSVERAALVPDPRTGELKLYVPVDRGENEWCVLKLDDAPGPAAFDAGTARPVLVPAPGTTDEVTVKDPVVLSVDDRFYMYYAGHDGTSEQAHLATSSDGEDWERVETNPVLGRGGWHDHHTRVSCVLPDPGPDPDSDPDSDSDSDQHPDTDGWLVCYDGSGRADYGATWNLRTGLAASPDLERVVDETPDRPHLGAPGTGRAVGLDTFGTCRYLDVLLSGDRLELFAEVARPNGSFELVRWVVPWPPDA